MSTLITSIVWDTPDVSIFLLAQNASTLPGFEEWVHIGLVKLTFVELRLGSLRLGADARPNSPHDFSPVRSRIISSGKGNTMVLVLSLAIV